MSLTVETHWDCECDEGFIHAHKNGNYCKVCKCFSDDMPDSRALEVPQYYKLENDAAIEFRAKLYPAYSFECPTCRIMTYVNVVHEDEPLTCEACKKQFNFEHTELDI